MSLKPKKKLSAWHIKMKEIDELKRKSVRVLWNPYIIKDKRERSYVKAKHGELLTNNKE